MLKYLSNRFLPPQSVSLSQKVVLHLFNSMSLVELMVKLCPLKFELSTNVLDSGQFNASYFLVFFFLSRFYCLLSIWMCRINPIVLGTKPMSCEGHSAVFLKDRILIVKKNSKPDDHTWFLEVRVFRPNFLAIPKELFIHWNFSMFGLTFRSFIINSSFKKVSVFGSASDAHSKAC